MIVTNSYLSDFIILIITLVATSIVYIKYKYNYWKNRGIVQLTPTFPFGNYTKALPRGISLGAITKRYYDEFKKMGCKFGGVYIGLDPYLVIVDPSYAKDVLTEDFQYFVDRGLYISKKDPLSVHILSQRGEEWKTSRNKFSVMFTSAKMKQFFQTMSKCSQDLRNTLDPYGDGEKDLDIFETFACYATDVIGSVVFGVEANSFKRSDAIFRQLGRKIFTNFTILDQVRLFLTICYPDFSAKMGVSNIQPYIQDFYLKFMKEALDYREKNNIIRQDFIQLLIEMKRSGIELTLEEMTSQALLFFVGGFETSSGSATLILFELGLHQDVQDKVREEINQVLKRHDGILTYEAISELTYLRQIFDESARKYPQITNMTRICVKDYTFKNTDITIHKGTYVLLPVLGYHWDEDYYPDPSKWDPDRFADKNEKHVGYYPFGDGPRICIGARFGLMQVILGVVAVLKDFKVYASPNTKLPLEFDELTFVTKMRQTIFLRLKKIK
ncbi:probable cytochrome P450 6a20 isoform X2 [Diorhabda sublineata]|nr:probable cytochrome P450 6a20 isoform X2 [Diorhabda sublineata]